MTPATLRTYCELFNDDKGAGGQTRLANLLDWSDRTMRRKLAGDSPIDKDEALAIEHLVICRQATATTQTTK